MLLGNGHASMHSARNCIVPTKNKRVVKILFSVVIFSVIAIYLVRYFHLYGENQKVQSELSAHTLRSRQTERLSPNAEYIESADSADYISGNSQQEEYIKSILGRMGFQDPTQPMINVISYITSLQSDTGGYFNNNKHSDVYTNLENIKYAANELKALGANYTDEYNGKLESFKTLIMVAYTNALKYTEDTNEDIADKNTAMEIRQALMEVYGHLPD